MGDLHTLLAAEMAEQEAWPVDTIPAWHPRNEGDGDDDGDDGDDDSDDNEDDTRTDAEKAAAAAQEAVDAAHAKLRASEKEVARLAKANKAHERSGLAETERLKQEAEDARAETVALQSRLDAADRDKTIITLAKALKFKDPDVAELVPASLVDEGAIKDKLKALAKKFPDLVGTGSASPPINGDTNGNNGSTNARMNDALRKAAGRT